MELILELVKSYPGAAGVLSGLYLFSLLNKALFTALHTYVESTPGKEDDEKLKKVESNKIYRAIAWGLDLVARIKLPLKK